MAPVLGSSSSSTPSSAPLSTSSFEPQGKPPTGWKDLLKTSSPYNDNHHYYGAEYPCRYPGNTPGSPAALQTIITTTTKVSPTGGSIIHYVTFTVLDMCLTVVFRCLISLVQSLHLASRPTSRVPHPKHRGCPAAPPCWMIPRHTPLRSK